MTIARIKLKDLIEELKKQPEGIHMRFWYDKQLKSWTWLGVNFPEK